MKVYNTLFVINLIILLGITVYGGYKKRKKAVVFNSVILSLFVLLKLTETNYIAIRAGLFDLLGEEKFFALKAVLRKVLFFSTSITVGIQLIIEIISLVLLIIVVANAAIILIESCTSKAFNFSVLPKDEKVEHHKVIVYPSLYLILERLIC